ncbi:MAG TPA: hypothetical protein VMV28_04710 [Thermoplasmata archaeon]|nr:hypothetical protein [Thermoplasmata archaeon]
MTTFTAWLLAILAVIGLLLALDHLGVDVAGSISSGVHAVEHVLNRPL